jgi:hypothetical protein
MRRLGLFSSKDGFDPPDRFVTFDGAAIYGSQWQRAESAEEHQTKQVPPNVRLRSTLFSFATAFQSPFKVMGARSII